MAAGQLSFDHLVISARSLDEGCAYVKDILGIDMPPGGAHPAMSTHNRLMALGPTCFLEVIAINPAAPPPGRARLFDLDRFDETPKLCTWVAGTRDVASELANAPAELGPAIPLSRGALQWLLTVPEDGSLPCDGAFPSLIQWPEGPLPAASMVDLGLRMTELRITHPRAGEIDRFLGHRIDRDLIKVETGTAGLAATIETPSGARILT